MDGQAQAAYPNCLRSEAALRGFFYYGDAGARPDAGSTGPDHAQGRVQIADPAGRFDLHLRRTGSPHEPDGFFGRAVSGKTAGGLDVSRAGGAGQT